MLTTNALNKMLGVLVNNTQLGLRNASGVELAGSTYQRKTLTSNMFTISNGELSNNQKIYMNECEDSAGWGTASQVAIYNSDGTVYYVGELTESQPVLLNYMPKFPVGAFHITMTAVDSQ